MITAGAGLLSANVTVTVENLNSMAQVAIDLTDREYRKPLERDLRDLACLDCPVIFLGSIATDKYLLPLKENLGYNLKIPMDFAGRGDMSRGGLLLRAARESVELTYVSAEAAARHAPRRRSCRYSR